MSTSEERVRIYKLWLLLGQLEEEGHKKANQPYPTFFSGGISDEKAEQQACLVWEQYHHRGIGEWMTADSIRRELYRIWPRNDVELAIEEGQRRIGSLPYVD